MQIKDKKFFREMLKANIILKSGRLNTRWKIMLHSKFPNVSAENKFNLFSIIWDYKLPACKVCCKSTEHKFLSPNFITGKKAFSDVCSDKCGAKLKSLKISEFRKNENAEAKRVEKFRHSVSLKDDTGQKISSRIAEKAAITKTNKKINGVSIIELQTEKAKHTKIAKGLQIPDDKLKPFHLYRKTVHKLSSRQPINELINFEKRGHYNSNGYHLDHIVSIKDGFRYGIPPEVIAHIVNLRFIPAIDNYSKGGKSSQPIADLIRKYFEHTTLKEILYI